VYLLDLGGLLKKISKEDFIEGGWRKIYKKCERKKGETMRGLKSDKLSLW
jgi:hypothetical protein